MNLVTTRRISYDKLTCLLAAPTVHGLAFCMDSGNIQTYKLEKGLRASIINCRFREDVELFNDTESGLSTPYFTIVCFLNTKGLQVVHGKYHYVVDKTWDQFLVSAASACTMQIKAGSALSCLVISFSPEWIQKTIGNNLLSNIIIEKLHKSDEVTLASIMTSPQKKQLEELLHTNHQNHFGSFYIKGAILKLVCDFIQQLKEQRLPEEESLCHSTIMAKAEAFLTEHLKTTLPDLKALAKRLSISESTLKRHFRKKYGMNMSTYFISRKVAYARMLIQEHKISLAEAAKQVGYQSVHGFITALKKYASIDYKQPEMILTDV